MPPAYSIFIKPRHAAAAGSDRHGGGGCGHLQRQRKSWTDTNVTKGTKCTYTVRGVNANGTLSPGFDRTGVSAVAK